MKAIAFVLLAACGASPNQPVLANAPRPDPGAVAGIAAAAAAAVTLAAPDAARKPEKNEDSEKKAIKVKESVPSSVLDRLDKSEANKQPAQDAPQPTLATDQKDPPSALDFSELPPPPGTKR